MKVLVYGAKGSQQFPEIKPLQKKVVKVVATTHLVEKLKIPK